MAKTLKFIQKENSELKKLNTDLVNELEIFRYKDSLKEAQYIIDGQYNRVTTSQKHNYILNRSKSDLMSNIFLEVDYLKAINYNENSIKEKIAMEFQEKLDSAMTSFAEETEELYTMVSQLSVQCREIGVKYDEVEAEKSYIKQDCDE